MKVLVIFGTRPEAIKIAPVVSALEREPEILVSCCSTGQHREMLAPLISLFRLRIDIDLDVMTEGQSLAGLAQRALDGLARTMERLRPELVVVQGDTTTAFVGALAAFYAGIRVAHVEAGLRTWDLRSPWPEEGNRQLVTRLASLHFAPTAESAGNLTAENVARSTVFVTGNTVIDALLAVCARLDADPALASIASQPLGPIDTHRRIILATCHRRENFDGGVERVCRALATIAARGDVQIVFPIHLNPNVQDVARRILGGVDNVLLMPPLPYVAFVSLMRRANLIISDSGGIQEEAPALGKPVLVTRDSSERPEAIEAGVVRLVGTDERSVVGEASRLLDDPVAYAEMAQRTSPYGDGRASERIVDAIMGRTVEEFEPRPSSSAADRSKHRAVLDAVASTRPR